MGLSARSTAVTPFGQLAFFIEFLKNTRLWDGWVAECPVTYASPNAPAKADVLGTVVLSVLAGHRRYAHITALRFDGVNLQLLGMTRVCSEDSVRRAFTDVEPAACATWLTRHLRISYEPLLHEPWILDAPGDSGKHAEAITSRPLLLNTGKQTTHSGQTTVTVTSMHAKAPQMRSALRTGAIHPRNWQTTAVSRMKGLKSCSPCGCVGSLRAKTGSNRVCVAHNWRSGRDAMVVPQWRRLATGRFNSIQMGQQRL
jgi:hypothetical protein